MAHLEARDIAMGFGQSGKRREVLGGVDLAVERGEFVAIVGYSGSGKTTLVSILAGLLAPERGSVHVAGHPAKGPGPNRGVVFQNYSLLPWLTVYENIWLAVDNVFADWPHAKKAAQVEHHVMLVNLLPARNKRPAELSGGMRQRVALARALATDPDVLLLDEPLSALDALTRATLQDEIQRIRADTGKTIVMVTNDVDEGILLADRIIPLSAGPSAVLGPAVVVDIERPRSRKALNHDERFRTARREVMDYLLGPGAPKRSARRRTSLQPLASEPAV